MSIMSQTCVSSNPSPFSTTTTSLHLHIDVVPGTEVHLHLKTNPGEQLNEETNQRDFVNTMVDEIVRHPQTDFAICLAGDLGVGDLFENYLMEQTSAQRTSKEKVQTYLM